MLRQARFAVAAVLIAASSVGAQQAPSHSGSLTISADPAKVLTLKPADLATMPRTSVVMESDGQKATYEGVLVGELLKRAGAPLGGQLRGDAVSSYVVASASDGYRALFSLAELDPAFTGSQIMVADKVDGKPLFSYQGPFRIVAPKDLAGARSIRMLERIEVVRLPKP
jgi:hypothetical protein